jgi:hypothetical protein
MSRAAVTPTYAGGGRWSSMDRQSFDTRSPRDHHPPNIWDEQSQNWETKKL